MGDNTAIVGQAVANLFLAFMGAKSSPKDDHIAAARHRLFSLVLINEVETGPALESAFQIYGLIPLHTDHRNAGQTFTRHHPPWKRNGRGNIGGQPIHGPQVSKE